MELLNKIKKFENLHILFWLVKDSCWMFGFKELGTVMIFPTITLAVMLVYHTRKTEETLINVAVLCWIVANSFWMLMEFSNHLEYKTIASIPFLLGLLCVGLFYYKKIGSKQPKI